MKKTLLFFTTLITLVSFGQVPVNDLLENATLINTFPYTDSNIRMDLATASGISPAGCPVGNYNLVYYKFTATNSYPVEINLEDSSAGALGQTFAIVFSAPSLSITDETELTTVSACAFTPGTTFTPVSGNNYYVLIHRPISDALTNIIFTNETPLAVPGSERDALIALYNSTNGGSWTNNTNWNSAEPVYNWYGVTTENIGGVGHVTEITLGSNNLTGTLPTEIGDFPELTSLGLWANQITGNIPPEIGNLTNLVMLDMSPNTFSGTIPPEIGNLTNLEILWLNQNGLSGTIPASFQNLVNLRELYLIGGVGDSSEWASSVYSGDFPDLTALPLETLRIEKNFFHFDDIADEFATYQANIPNFIFEPQYTIDPPEEVTPDVGEDITLTLTDVPGTTRVGSNLRTDNIYQWFKDDVSIDGADQSTYTIVNAQPSDSGVYSCQITNPDVPGFIVTRSGITVDVGGTLSIDNFTSKDISIYPNPTTNYINIKMENAINSTVTIYDLRGRKITNQNIYSETSRIDTNNLQPGIYVLKLENEQFSTTQKILKK